MIQAKLCGRMGNQMFQYAVARIVAESKGYNFYIPEFGDPSIDSSTEGHHLSNFFPGINLGVKDGDIIHNYYEDHTIQKYNPKIFNIPDYTYLNGFFQTDKYFINKEEEVKSYFQIVEDSKTLDILRRYNINDYCYIHIRASDYLKHEHWFLDKSFYINSMNYISSLKNINFLIITDDIETCNKMFPDIESISNDMITDFKLLYYAKYSIISNSTFSWWAAWLSNKSIVIAPNHWLNHNKPERGFYPVDIKSLKFKYV